MAIIIDIDHEGGDLAEYSSTNTDSGDLSVAAGAALAGTNYGLSLVIDDATGIYGIISFASPYSTTGIFRGRFYIDPNSLTMANGNNFRLVAINNSALGSVAEIRLGYTTGTGHTIAAMIVDDTAAESFTTYYGITDEPHYVEFNLIRATNDSSADGSIQLWIDGVSKQTVGSKDNYDRFNTLRVVNFGAISGIDAGTSGTFYLDELVVNDDGGAIGPVITESASVSPSASGSPSASVSPSSSASPSVSPSASVSPSSSESPSVSPSSSESPSVSPSASVSPSSSESPSVSPSASVSPSSSESPSVSPSASVSPSSSESPSVSPSASVSPSSSESPSVSPSASLSPSSSESPSVSPSASESPSSSESASESPSSSESPSVSPSASGSASLSPSASASPSEGLIEGTVCWGHVTGVTETNTRTFADNWTGTGAIENSGDAERLALDETEYMISETVYTGAFTIELSINVYAAGDTVTIKYRTGADQAACESAEWSTYSTPFDSLGYVQARVDY